MGGLKVFEKGFRFSYGCGFIRRLNWLYESGVDHMKLQLIRRGSAGCAQEDMIMAGAAGHM